MTKTSQMNLKTLSTFAILALGGCTTVPAPTHETTPPTLRWTVIDKATNVQTNFNTNGTVNAKLGDAFTVILVAEDVEGIHEITLGNSVGWTCRSGDIAQSVGPSLGAVQKQDLQPNAQNQVLTSIFLIDNASATGFDCQSGFKFVGGSIQFFGTGTDYANHKVSGTLTFNVAG